jgi:stage V sporulation protein B
MARTHRSRACTISLTEMRRLYCEKRNLSLINGSIERRLNPVVVHGLVSLTSQAVFAGSTLLTSVMTSRALGRADKGLLALLVLIPVVMQLLLDVGIEQGLTVKVAKGSLVNPRLHAALLGIMTHGLAGSLLAIVIISAASGKLSLAAIDGPTTSLFAAACALAIVQHDISGLLYGYKEIPFVSSARATGAAMITAGSAVLYTMGGHSVTEYFAVYVAGMAGLVAVLGLRLARLLVADPHARIGQTVRWRMVSRTGLPFYGANLSHIAVTRTDSLILGATRPSSELGLYSSAVNVAEFLWYLPSILAEVVLPHSIGNPNRRLCKRSLLMVFMISLITSVVLALTGRRLIVILFGDEFVGSFQPLLLLLPGAVAMSCARIGQVWLLIYGRAAAVRMINFIASITGATVWLVAIPRVGLMAAAIVSSGVYFAIGLATVIALLRTTRDQHVRASSTEIAKLTA